MRICILGCGPAGLVAAHTATELGHDVTILANRAKSDLYGCQYLHGPIHGIDVQTARVRYVLRGSVRGYRDKVYGREWQGKVSPEDLVGSHMAWDIRQAYDKLWGVYGDSVSNMHVTSDYAGYLAGNFGLVISSIPAYAICYQNHRFYSRVIRADGSAPWKRDALELREDTVVCDGTRSVSWYRASRVFGHSTVEWPDGVGEGVSVRKPLSTNCDCYPTIVRVGRYGAWDKAKLVHQVVDEVRKALS